MSRWSQCLSSIICNSPSSSKSIDDLSAADWLNTSIQINDSKISHVFFGRGIAFPPLPPRIEELLPAQFAAAPTVALPCAFDPELTRFFQRSHKAGSSSESIPFNDFGIPGSELERLTIWLSLLLASDTTGAVLPARAWISARASPSKYSSQLNACTDLNASLTLREIGRRMQKQK
jgi:hypothetical protein